MTAYVVQIEPCNHFEADKARQSKSSEQNKYSYERLCDDPTVWVALPSLVASPEANKLRERETPVRNSLRHCPTSSSNHPTLISIRLTEYWWNALIDSIYAALAASEG
jgi:hypothetical protein